MKELAQGTILGDTYEIIEQIGMGGGGIVYRARHLRLQTDVVVKKIKDEVADRLELRKEADILKNLKHPYLPRVYDFIETQDGVYTVMDYISGENMEDAVKKHGRFSQKQVRKWAEQLGEALAYLHGQNPPVIHSDIKPANIMLTQDGDICLIDFNISLALGEDMESAVGISAGFSPPEQYRDMAVYARITKNYTIQRSNDGKAAAQKSKAQDEDRTELLPDTADEGKTVLLPGTADEEKTVLLSDTADEEKTVLLPGTADEERTVLLSDTADEERTVLLSDTADEEKTVLLSDTADEEKTVLLSGTADEEKTVLLSDTADEGKTAPLRSDITHAGSKERPATEYEQSFGKGINARSDIYSLGMTLYYLLTGIEPSADFGQRIPIYQTNAQVSEGFALILDKMMAFPPEKRYADGTAFLKALRSCHKLDRRYIAMRRKQTAIQGAGIAALACGVLLTFFGFYRIRIEKDSAYYSLISQAQTAMGGADYDEAVLCLAQAKEMDGARTEAYEEEVHMLYLKNDYEECIRQGEFYINTIPFEQDTESEQERFANLYYLVGNAYYETEDYSNAEKYMAQALQIYDGNGLYYRDHAIALAKLGRIDEAKEQLEKGIAIGITEDSIYMAQGEIAHVQGQYADAADYLDRTVTLTDDQSMKKRAILLLVDVYRDMGESSVDKEIALLEQYAGQFDQVDALVMKEYLADAYTRKAQSSAADAASYYEKALALFEQVRDGGYVTYQLQQNIAILYEDLGRFDEAEQTLLAMAQDYPERYESYKRLAFLDADRQQTKENADRDYTKTFAYYEQAKELYDDKAQDMEMQMLDNMIRELQDGGWQQ